MPNVIKYSTGSTPAGCLRKGNMLIGNGSADNGVTFYTSIAPAPGKYTIYLNKASGGPSIYCPTDDTQLVKITNNIAGTSYSTVAECLAWFATQTDKIIFNNDYPSIVTDGLALDLDFGFVASYPTTSTTIYDLSGNGNNGTLTNGPTFSSANNGVLTLDGSNDYVIIPNNSSFNVTDNITIEMWVKIDAAAPIDTCLLRKYVNGYLFYVDSNSKFAFDSRNGDGTYYRTVGTTNIKDGVWKHLVAQKSGLYYSVYVNGRLEGTLVAATVGDISSNVDLYLGTDTGSYLSGQISNVRIYNRTLSAAEIFQNYSATAAKMFGEKSVTSGLRLGLDAKNLTSYGGNGSTWYDVSGFGNNGALANGPIWDSNGWFTVDGVNDYITIAGGTLNNGSTLEMWFKQTTNKQVELLKYGTGTIDTPGCHAVYYTPNTLRCLNFINGSRTFVSINHTINLGDSVWRQLLLSYTGDLTGGTASLYINGQLITSTSATSINSSFDGPGFSSNSSYAFPGNVSTLRVYNRGLSATEVLQNYYKSNIVTNGLVFAIDASNLVSYPKSGTTAYTLTGSNTGTLINGTGYSNINGGTWIFDGVDDGINIGTLTPTGGATFEAWINITSGNSNYGAIFTNWNSSANAFFIGTYPNSNYIQVYFNSNLIFEVLNLPFSTWILLTVTNNGSNVLAYVNGVLTNTAAGTLVSATGVTSIGYDVNRTNYPFKGNISNAKIYDRALTAAEVQQNYNATLPNFQDNNIVTGGLVAYVDAADKASYPGSGNTWYDISGSGNNFTFSATPNIVDGVFNSGASVYAYRNAIAVDSSIKGYTLEACFKINASTGSSWQNITQNGGGDPARHMMWYNGGTNTFKALFHTPNSYNNISDTLSPGVWYHLILSYDPSGGGYNGRRAWLNGVEKVVDDTAAGNAIPSGYFTIAVDSDLTSNKSNVSYSFMRYYNRALSQAEALRNYNASRDKFQKLSPVTGNLIMSWDVANPNSYSGSGTTIYDLSGNNNYGLLLNGITYTGQFGGTLVCDPTDEFVVCANPLDTNYVSVEVFYTRASAANNVDDIVVNKEGVWEVKDVGGSLEWALMTNNQSWFWQPTGFTIAVGETAHIVLTYDGNSVNFYKNGALYSYAYPSGGVLSTGSYPKFNSRGSGQTTSQYPGAHNLHAFRIYNRALTQAEVNQNFNSQRQRFGI